MMKKCNDNDLSPHLPIINDYNEVASAYDDAFGDDYWNCVGSVLLKAIQQFFGPSTPKKCLDLACGTGTFLAKLFTEYQLECHGVDLSEKQVEIAKSKLRSVGAEINLATADLLRIPFPCDCDIVTINLDALNHLYHAKDWPRLFRKVYHSLSHTGLFMFDVNTPSRLLRDWDYPEVIIKPNLCYVQHSLTKPEIKNGHVRREIIMMIYLHTDGSVRRYAARIKQLAISNHNILNMLEQTGFSDVIAIDIPNKLRSEHIFLKNRQFFTAHK